MEGRVTATDQLEAVLQAVSCAFGCPREQLVGNRRYDAVVLPRHAYYYLARLLGRSSYPQIAIHIGRTTGAAFRGAGKCRDLMAYSSKYALMVRQAESMIQHPPPP
jgi:chromosomal replication initiation ATPase DnaA